ncbi:MAG: zf-HC2 domain-containing protein [Anaerolineales bacterium]|nr:zf-HC2 domain-containing protein [Anaerolineales bacterium]MCS7249019.1 zf-HC2 domain-containing protein [Anaerolineales bacterium]MDW8162832.1 zf-HC2 domain-containing protein [Anaerolineales bacterium]MDW8446337.1 zf-HC2 domain-containing protein [Anaerolineales bacterium]
MTAHRPSCREMLSALSEYLDGELASELCAAIEVHLAECKNCRIVVDTLRKTITLYHQYAEEEASLPQEVRYRLFKRLNLEDFLEGAG